MSSIARSVGGKGKTVSFSLKRNHGCSKVTTVQRRRLVQLGNTTSSGGKHQSWACNAASSESSTTTTDGLNRDGLKTWDPTNWVEPAAHNKTSFRILAIAAAVAVGASCSNVISPKWGGFAHLIAFATWFGSNFWTTFIGGITMYKNLPRQTFGNLQAKLFPKYFQLSTVTILTSLVTMRAFGSVATLKPVYITLALSLVATLLNLLWLEPAATEVMFERYGLENLKEKDTSITDKITDLKKQFGKWHGMSSLANLVALCGSVSHGFWLAMRLV